MRIKRNNPIHEAERATLGAAILDAETIPAIAAKVDSGSFDIPVHGLIWAAITAQHAEGKPTDPVALAARLADEGDLAKVGGGPYLHELIEAVPAPQSGPYYAEVVADAANRRELKAVSIRLAQAAEKTGEDLSTILDRSRTALDEVTPGQNWADPIPLTGQHQALPAFPAVALPDWLGDMIDAVAAATQTPTDLAGLIGLAALSTAMQGRLAVQAGPDWIEPCNLFTAVGLAPGNRKSATFGHMMYPILAAEAELAEAARPAIIEAATEAEIAKRAAEQALAAASRDPSDPDAANGAKSAAMEAEAITIPVEPKLVADDITPEAAKTLLAEQGGRLAILSAEGGIFATIAGRYSGVPDLDVFLKGHAGDLLRVARKSAPAEYVPNPALTVGLAVQPEVLREAARMPGFEDRGLMARFLYALPVSTVGSRNPSPPAIPGHVKATYASNLAALVHDMHRRNEPVVLDLTPEARQRVVDLEAQREPRLAPGGQWEPILNWANKWTGAVVRLAGLLHVAEYRHAGTRMTIEADMIDRATVLGYYFADHALAAFAYMGATPENGPAAVLLDWLAAHGDDGISIREMYRALRGRKQFNSAEKVRAAAAVLVDHGWLREVPGPRRRSGRPPAPRFQLHPEMTKAGGSV